MKRKATLPLKGQDQYHNMRSNSQNNHLLNERSQTKMNIYCMTLLHVNFRECKIIYSIKTRSMIEQRQDGGITKGCENTFGGAGYVHYLDLGDGFTGISKFMHMPYI